MEVNVVMQNDESSQRFWNKFHGPNLGYVEEQYELYKEAPENVDPSIKEMFDQHGAPNWLSGRDVSDQEKPFIKDVQKLTAAIQLVEAIRRYGHIEADIYPVGNKDGNSELIKHNTYNLSEDDLREIPASWLWENAPTGIDDGFEVVQYLKKRYTGKISFEYDHVNNNEERRWLLDQIESDKFQLELPVEDRKQLLERLVHIEGFEMFLQKTFQGQKRFSIEGLEMMVPILDQIVKHVTTDKIDNIMMGMAHRGRLSVLAHVLGKPIDKIFSEFHHSPDKELIPSEG